MKFLAPILTILCLNFSYGQVKIGNDISTIDPYSILELESNSRALVLTRVSASEMLSMTPLNGAMVYNTDTQCVHYFNGNIWQNLCDTSNIGSNLVNNQNGTFTFTDSTGTQTTFYGKPDTVTTLVNNLDGTYTYTNEDGTETTITSDNTDNQNISTDGDPGSIAIENGDAIFINVEDADADAGNEIQDLRFSTGIITLTQDPDATLVDLSNYDTDISDDFDGEWTSLNNIPANLDTDSTDDFSGAFGDLTGVPANLDTDSTDDFDGEWTSLNNIPVNLDTDSTDDFSGSFTDLTSIPVNLDVDSTNDFSGSFTDLTNVPANLDTDSTDDFSGSFTDLTNLPVNLDTDSTDDFDGEWTSLNNIPANLDTDSTDDFSGSFTDLTNVPANLDTDSTDDFDGEWVSLNNIPVNLDTDSTDDFSGSFTDLTNVPANLDTDSTDDFSGDFNDLTNVPVNLDTDSTDDFSGSFTDLTNMPANLDTDSTDDFDGEWTSLNNIPVNLDTDSTDDFSGSFTDLTSIPVNLDVDSTNDFSGSFTDLTNVPANLDTDSTDDFSGSFTDLTNLPVNLDTDSTDDFSGDFNDLTNVPAGVDVSGTEGSIFFADTDGTATENNGQFFWDNSLERLGIGTSNIDAKLHVAGSIRGNRFAGNFGSLDGPTFRFSGDIDTGIFRAASNQLGFVTGGVNALTVDASQKIGIGTETPDELLHIAGNMRLDGGLEDKDGDSGTAGQLLSSTTTGIDWIDPVITFSGSFTDLTNVPANLDTDSTDDFDGEWTSLSNIPTAISDGDDVDDADNNPANEIQTLSISENDLTISGTGGNTVTLPTGGGISGTEGSLFYADTDGSATENNTQLFWNATNNRLGIGTSTPTHKLQVSGQVRATSFANANGTAGSPAYRFNSDGDTGIFRAAANQLGLSTNGTEAIRIDASQNVGIGTDTPDEKLQIAGNMRLDGSFEDKDGDAGTAGQVLSSTATGTDWVDATATSAKLNYGGRWTNTNTSTDLNVDNTLTPIFGSEDYKDDGNNLYEVSGNTLIVKESGRYDIRANLSLLGVDTTGSSEERTNTVARLAINGTLVGAFAATGFIRFADNHDHSSIHISEILQLNANDVISIVSFLEANFGIVRFSGANESSFMINKLR